MLQESTYAEDEYQEWRSELVGTCYAQVLELNTELIAVKLRMQSVEKFKRPGSFDFINEGDKGELLQQIAPIVRLDDTDEYHVRPYDFSNGADAILSICAKTAEGYWHFAGTENQHPTGESKTNDYQGSKHGCILGGKQYLALREGSKRVARFNAIPC